MTPITIIGLAAAFCTTFSFLPQAIKTIQTKDTSGISLSMYLIFTLGCLFWFIYGYFSHDLPVTLANLITFSFAFTILMFKIKYK